LLNIVFEIKRGLNSEKGNVGGRRKYGGTQINAD